MTVHNPLRHATLLTMALLLAACGQKEPTSSSANVSAPTSLPKVEASSGMLRIVTEPGDAQIFINGQRKGNSPAEVGQSFAIKLGEASYTVEAVKPNGDLKEWYGKKTDVFVANESLQTLSLSLEERDTAAGKAAREKADTAKKQEAAALFAKAFPSGAPVLVSIPAGVFEMGCSREPCNVDTKPVHRVNVAAFQMGKNEVTFAEWDACVADGSCSHRPDDKGWGRGNQPVMNVSWDDVQTYITWINKKTGKTYRLPSEAEWEYAARAGTTTRFSTGDCISTVQANFDGNYPAEGCPKGEFREKTLVVGSFAANPYGLYDIHGNVWEWTQDCWNDRHSGATSMGSPRGDGNCNLRVLRGGSWRFTGRDLLSYDRGAAIRDKRMDYSGFRLAKSN